MTHRILCVDDEPNILQAYERLLRRYFPIETAVGSEAGLAAMREKGPYAVVVSDMRMPVMDGVQFLAKVREHSPDTVRIMLTGQADMDDAIAAVNEGNIFRFLTKPCPTDLLRRSLEAALEQHRLITSERELLEQTLNGSIKVLTEVLSLVNPTAFGRSHRVERYVRHIAAQLKLTQAWEFEMAAMLSQIGCISVPPHILEKVYAGEPLTDDETQIFGSHPAVAHELLAKIPRLEGVSLMVQRQLEPSPPDLDLQDRIALGAQMLRVAIDFDARISRGELAGFALERMRQRAGHYEPRLLGALTGVEVDPAKMVLRAVQVDELKTGAELYDDVWSENGILLLAKGQEVTETVIMRLKVFERTMGVRQPFKVMERHPGA